MIHIPNIQFKLLCPTYCITPVTLCPSGDTRTDLMSTDLFFLNIEGDTAPTMDVEPINAISPLRTLINCGNSSIEVERTNFPTFVKRFSSGKRFPSVSRSSVMVLNLITLNILPFIPGRSCKKKAPVPLFAKCSQKVIRSNTGQIIVNTQNTRMKSITLLKSFYTW